MNSRPSLPWPITPMNHVLISSRLADPNTLTQLVNVVDAFNSRSMAEYGSVGETFTTSWVRGKRLNPTEFLFFHRNQVPCVTQDHVHQLARVISLNPGVKIEEVGTALKGEPHISVMGSHILNVPTGYLAKVFLGSSKEPVLLDQGPHVIHDSTFATDGEDSYLMNKSFTYIKHGVIHLLRVLPGRIAKVWYGNQAVLLESQVEPYVVVSPLFRFDKDVDQNDPLISHGNSHRVRVPRGKLAAVWVDNTPMLLDARTQAYEFVTPYFSVAGQDWLKDTNDKLIVHGSIKRILPSTGEVCVVYENGALKILAPDPRGKPYMIDNETHLGSADKFLPNS